MKRFATMVKCLGWCEKEFLSPDPSRVRFCRRCAEKKDHAQRNLGGRVASVAESVKGINYE